MFDHWKIGDVYLDEFGERRECLGFIECTATCKKEKHPKSIGCPGRPKWSLTSTYSYCPGKRLFIDDPPTWVRIKRVEVEQETIENRIRRITETINKEVYGDGK